MRIDVRHHKDHVLMIISFSFHDLDDNTNLVLACVKYVLNPSQIIRRLTFLTPSLTTRLIQNFVQNITSFVMAWFINKSSSRMT